MEVAQAELCLLEQQQRDDTVWRLLLSKLWQLEAHVLCKLMCCSKSMAALVHSTCAGRLRVGFRCTAETVDDERHQEQPTGMPLTAMSFQLWLLRNCGLVQALDLEVFEFVDQERRFMLTSREDRVKAVLAAATPTQLQQFTLTGCITQALMDSFAPAMQQLARLTSLSICYIEAHGSLQPFLQHLPAALVSLDLDGTQWRMHTYEGQRQQPGSGWQHMQHLTALKSLRIPDTFAGDILALALTALTVCECHDIAPVTKHTRLRQLSIDRVLQSAVHSTHELSRMVQLQELSLNCGNRGTRGSCRYPACPGLKRLKLRRAVTSAPVTAAISQTRQLTALELVDVQVNRPHKVLAALQQLQGLRVLKLSFMSCTAADMQELLAGVAELGSLRELVIAYTNLKGTSCTRHLARSTQLQHITLFYCYGINKPAVSALRAKLPNCKCVFEPVPTATGGSIFYEATIDFYRHNL